MIQPPAPLAADFDLSARNTLGLRSRARFGGVLTEVAQIAEAVRFARAMALPFHLLGGGSNCVLAPEVPTVVGIAGLMGRRVERTSGGSRIVARAGEEWDGLVRWAVAQGIGGLENLAGIPGRVGAAPVQNIGAYGVELSDVLEAVTALDTISGEMRRFTAAECRLAYRHSRFKDTPGRYLIAEVALLLPGGWRPVLDYAGLADLPGDCGPGQVMRAVLARRGARLPDWRQTGNAGSFFHNPVVPEEVVGRIPAAAGRPVAGGVKLSAGWLLEACGFKGRRQGGAGFSDRHALVLVNHGAATFDDVTELAAQAVAAVRTRFGVTLVQEPVRLGAAEAAVPGR